MIIIFDQQQQHQSRNGASFVKDCADYDGVILMRLLVLLLEMERDASFSNNGQIYTKYIITHSKEIDRYLQLEELY